MKKLFLDREQAKQLGEDLIEYIAFKDSNDRNLFKGFEISYGDMLATEIHSDQDIEMVPISEFTLIEGEK